MSAPGSPRRPEGDEELVEFLRRETGEHLHVVLRFDADSWTLLHASDVAQGLLLEADADVDDLLETFRREGRRNLAMRSVYDLGDSYCSLHLFDRLVLIHFAGVDEGIIFGYDPAAASHLTGFVSLVLPYIRASGLEELEERPAWDRR